MVISIIMRDITVVHYNFQFKYATRKIKPYIYSLTEGISSSKLSYARMLMSDKAFDDYNTKVIPTLQALISKVAFNSEVLINVLCDMIFDASEDPLLKAFSLNCTTATTQLHLRTELLCLIISS